MLSSIWNSQACRSAGRTCVVLMSLKLTSRLSPEGSRVNAT